MPISVDLGNNIVRLRKERRISQEQLALRSNISISYLRMIEHGVANPTLDILDKIARILEVPLPTLFLAHFSTASISEMLSALMEERVTSKHERISNKDPRTSL